MTVDGLVAITNIDSKTVVAGREFYEFAAAYQHGTAGAEVVTAGRVIAYVAADDEYVPWVSQAPAAPIPGTADCPVGVIKTEFTSPAGATSVTPLQFLSSGSQVDKSMLSKGVGAGSALTDADVSQLRSAAGIIAVDIQQLSVFDNA